MRFYIYLGDKFTSPTVKGILCIAVLRKDGKCVRGKNGNMLVDFRNGQRCVVQGRLLRKLDKITLRGKGLISNPSDGRT